MNCLCVFASLSLVVAQPHRALLSARHTLYNLTTPRGAMVSAQVGAGRVAFAGGSVDGSPKGTPPSDVVEILNVQTKQWEKTLQLPNARAGDSTTGGWLADVGVSFFGAGGGDSGRVDLLFASNLSWAPSVSTTFVHEFTACAGVGRTIVCAGGQGSKVKDQKHDLDIAFGTDVFTIYDDGSVHHDDTYRLSVGRKKLSAAAQLDIIGFAMGYSDVNETVGYSDAYDLFNTTSGQWTSGNLPSQVGRQYGTAVGCGGKLVFGGGQIGGRSNAVDIFDAKTGVWTNATLTAARSNLAAACAADRYAVFAGGQIPARDTVDVFDTLTGAWGTLDNLNFGRGWLVGGSVDNCAIFASGGAKGNHSSVDAYCFDTIVMV